LGVLRKKKRVTKRKKKRARIGRREKDLAFRKGTTPESQNASPRVLYPTPPPPLKSGVAASAFLV